MLPAPKRDEADGGMYDLVPRRGLEPALAQARESEGVEHGRVGVARVVRVGGDRCRSDERALGNARAVRERDVLERLAEDVH